jgi:cell division septal protein FtsQ
MFKKKNETPPDRNARMRNPTLTRSTISSSAVFSYHSSRAARSGATGRQEQAVSPAAIRSKKPFSLLNRGPVVLMLIVLIIITAINLFLSSAPEVIPVSTASSKIFLQNQDTYEAAARAALNQSVLSRTKLTINTERIAKDLQAQFPELAHVDVRVPFAGSGVKIYIEPSPPALLLSSGAEIYVVDANGRALIPAKQVPHLDKLGLPVVTDQSGLPITLGKPALPSSSVSFITEVVGQLKAKQIAISSLTLPAATSELDVRVAGAPYTVKYNLRGDARAEAGTYLAVKAQLEREKKTPSQYIDVRVEERAYYQ